ncbi:MAG: caspase family protein [Saprospiraceae bacterium]
MKRLFVISLLLIANIQTHAQNCTRGNCNSGFGTMVYPNNSKYTGEFVDGWMNGRGIYYYANGNKYIGNWLKNQKHGDGKLIYANGNIYSGKFQNDRITGFGNMNYKNGEKYVGEWKNENPSGKGTYYYASGERYEGEFINGKYNGKGKLYYTNGSTYEGEWKDDQRQGYGEYFDGQHKIVAGQWEKDNPTQVVESDFDINNDFVIMEDSSEIPATKKEEISQVQNVEKPKTKIEEPLIEDKKLEIVADSKIIETPSNAPKINDATISKIEVKEKVEEKIPNCNSAFCKSGKGTLDYADGSKFIGEFINGEPKGKGICYYANGDRYEGMWNNHAPDGEGVMYFKSGLIYGALWEHGTAKKQLSSKQEFVFNPNIKEDKNDEVKIWAVVVGVSRYEHMPSLKYSDDDAYKIYAFLKSPEGGALPDNQIKLLIDEDATRNKILTSLNELALKADENDVVMMYFSGHGLEGTFIPIDYDGYQNAVKHDEIRELFNKSHAKHKVCYADACHSGSLLAAKSPFASDLNLFYEELDKSTGGTAFLMSSKSKEYSLEDGGLRQGIFSHFLIRGLKGEADSNQNKTITIRELFDWVSKNVKEYSGSAQCPVIAGDYDENMPVGFVRSK